MTSRLRLQYRGLGIKRRFHCTNSGLVSVATGYSTSSSLSQLLRSEGCLGWQPRTIQGRALHSWGDSLSMGRTSKNVTHHLILQMGTLRRSEVLSQVTQCSEPLGFLPRCPGDCVSSNSWDRHLGDPARSDGLWLGSVVRHHWSEALLK